jgi:hypothetical protein
LWGAVAETDVDDTVLIVLVGSAPETVVFVEFAVDASGTVLVTMVEINPLFAMSVDCRMVVTLPLADTPLRLW